MLTQIQASFAVNALTVSMQGITTDLNTPATSVGTAITAGTFAMAAFILLGAKLGAKFGSRRVFQIAVVIHGLAMAAVAVSVSPAMLFIAQAASGAVIALIAPALVVFIAANYSGEQQARSIGFLAAAIPAAGVLALLIAGTFASTIRWRYSFALIVVLAAVNLLLSFRLKVVPPQPGVVIDWVGAFLAAGSIILLSFGFSGLNSWGVLLATPAAPFAMLGVSPAPILILLGAIGGQGFFVWLRRRKAAHLPQIFDLEVLKSGPEKATTFAMAAMLFVGTAANFLIPLYIQIVQGRSSFQTSISIIPYTLSIFIARLRGRDPVQAVPAAPDRPGRVRRRRGWAHPPRFHDPQRLGTVLRDRGPDHPRPRPGRHRRPRVQHSAVRRPETPRRRRGRLARPRAQHLRQRRHRRRERLRRRHPRVDHRGERRQQPDTASRTDRTGAARQRQLRHQRPARNGPGPDIRDPGPDR
ncbi:MFS transporter [Cryobacterium breve]|uniref:MFS transporter n=1 Tax=Cryobacterium breve TaxID=1259258 RepID=A0ABY7NCT6_9MICO|nr:MFS transporter [Cryobacterium breve]